MLNFICLYLIKQAITKDYEHLEKLRLNFFILNILTNII